MSCNRVLIIALFSIITATPVAAQTPPATSGGSESASFLRILLDGAEAPGAIIFLMSIAAVTISIEQFRSVRRKALMPPVLLQEAQELIDNRRYKECVARLQAQPCMFSDVLLAGLRQGRFGFDVMHRAAEEAAAVWSSRLFRRAEYLHVLGNLGPLMGLLGTVLGMIRAFSQMQEAHGAYKPEELAGGIALALVNTFLGLMLAIIALGAFGVCRNRVDSLTIATATAALALLEQFRPAPAGATMVSRSPKVEPDAMPRSGVTNVAQPASASG